MHHECGWSQRQIARSCGLSAGAVNKLLRLAGEAGLAWPLPPDLDERQLQDRLYGQAAGSWANRRLEVLDFAAVHKELRGRKNLTLQRLWEEYREQHADGYSYSQYCELYRQWKSRQDLIMLQEHKAGEKAFVDYAGQTVPIEDAESTYHAIDAKHVPRLSSDNYSCRRIASQRLLPGRGRCLTICVIQGDTMSSVRTQRGRSYLLAGARTATPS